MKIKTYMTKDKSNFVFIMKHKNVWSYCTANVISGNVFYESKTLNKLYTTHATALTDAMLNYGFLLPVEGI